jgi:hypothetical protein
VGDRRDDLDKYKSKSILKKRIKIKFEYAHYSYIAATISAKTGVEDIIWSLGLSRFIRNTQETALTTSHRISPVRIENAVINYASTTIQSISIGLIDDSLGIGRIRSDSVRITLG